MHSKRDCLAAASPCCPSAKFVLFTYSKETKINATRNPPLHTCDSCAAQNMHFNGKASASLSSASSHSGHNTHKLLRKSKKKFNLLTSAS